MGGTSTLPATGSTTVQNNASTAQMSAQGSVKGCPMCDRQGLPILPLRYAVIPAYLNNRPANILAGDATLGADVTNKALKGFKYTLRTLRGGYVYVYLGKPGAWQAYAVSTDGYLRLLVDLDDIDNKPNKGPSAQCKRDGHCVPSSFISIKDIEKTPFVWMAFSQDVWTAKVRTYYENDKHRTARMQKLDCKALASAPDAQPHAFEVKGNPEEAAKSKLSLLVEEYAADVADGKKRRAYSPDNVTTPEKDKKIEYWESVHGNPSRDDLLKPMLEFAKNYLDTKKKHIAAVALIDSDAIVQETNSARVHQFEYLSNTSGRADIFRKHQVSEAIKSLQILTKSQQVATAKANLPAVFKVGSERMSRYTYAMRKSRGGIPPTVVFVPDDPNNTASAAMGTVTTKQSDLDAYAQNRGAADAKPLIERLNERYSEPERKKFETWYDGMVAAFTGQMKNYDGDYTAWLNSSLWTRTFHDYDDSDPDSCAAYSTKIAVCLMGGPVSEASDAWWNKTLALGPTDESNPIYAALFGKQKDILKWLLPATVPSAVDLVTGGAPPDLAKADKLYDTVKGIVGTGLTKGANGKSTGDITERVINAVANKAANGIAVLQTTLAGALARLDKVATISTQVETTVLRTFQASATLYANADIAVLAVKMSIEEYRKVLFEQTWSVAQRSLSNVSRQGQRVVRSAFEGGIFQVVGQQARATEITALFVVAGDANALGRNLDNLTAVGSASMAMTESTTVRLARSHVINISHPLNRVLARLQAMTPRQMGAFVRGTGTVLRTTPAPMLAGAAAFFQYWALRQALKDVKEKIGTQKNDAQLAVMSAGIGLAGACTEFVGAGLGIAAKEGTKRFAVAAGFKVVGGAIAGAASFVDAYQAGSAAARSYQSGDYTATGLYASAGLAFVAGGATAIYSALAGAALLGPAGIALLLIAAGIALVFFAERAESTPMEMWVKRCYFGNAPAEIKYKDINTELSELNAIFCGLVTELGFEDPWNEFWNSDDQIQLRIKLPYYDAAASAFEVKLAFNNGTNYYSSHNTVGGYPPKGAIALPAPQKNGEVWELLTNVPIKSDKVSSAKVEVRYWIDRLDPQMVLTGSVESKD